jgi:hypothetical protein
MVSVVLFFFSNFNEKIEVMGQFDLGTRDENRIEYDL